LFVYFAMLGGVSDRDTTPLPEDKLQRLIALAREGDQVALQRIYEQFVNRVFRVVRPMFVSEAEAEDVTQDSLLKVLTSLESYRPRPESRFSSWVLRIAYNTARRRFRRRRMVPTDPIELASVLEAESNKDEPMDMEEGIDTERRRSIVLRALWQVPEREREVISLRYGAELNASEVATITGLNPANVRKICERLRPRLREQIELLLNQQHLGETP